MGGVVGGDRVEARAGAAEQHELRVGGVDADQVPERVEARHLSPTAGTAFGSASAPPPERREPPSRTQDGEERERIQAALRQQGGNVAATARALGMHRTQLRRLLERHAIEVSAGDGED